MSLKYEIVKSIRILEKQMEELVKDTSFSGEIKLFNHKQSLLVLRQTLTDLIEMEENENGKL